MGIVFQRELSIINFTLNYPPIRNNLTSASLLSMLIETDYLNCSPIRNNLTSASLLSMLIETDYLNYSPIRNNLSSAILPLSCAGEIPKILNSIDKMLPVDDNGKSVGYESHDRAALPRQKYIFPFPKH